MKPFKTLDSLAIKLLTTNVSKKYHSLTAYQIETGGKRLRPHLVLLCCKLLKGNEKEALQAGAAVEILHNYTLIIDDIIDKSPMRRNRKTVWKKFGTPVAECIAINYAASLIQYASTSKKAAQISAVLGKTLKAIVEGQLEDLEYTANAKMLHITQNNALTMMAKKTAVLFETCCIVSGMCANANPQNILKLGAYGFNFGMAFQIADDLADIFKKPLGQDIKEKKGGNIIIAHALEKLSKGDRATFNALLASKKIGAKEIQQCLAFISKTNAFKNAIALQQTYLEKAKQAIIGFPQNKSKEALFNLLKLIS